MTKAQGPPGHSISRTRTTEDEGLSALTYNPKPIDTGGVELPANIKPLVEQLAEHNHDVWAWQRLADGWTWGETRDDAGKKHPCLVPYAQLPESEKVYDRNAAIETLKAIVTLGYRIQSG